MKKNITSFISFIFIFSCSNNLNSNLTKTSELKQTNNKILANFDLKNIEFNDIEKIKIDNVNINNNELINNQEKGVIIPFIGQGKHNLQITHKKYGEFSVPVEIKDGIDNNFQINPKIVNDKVQSWEVIIYDNKLPVNINRELASSETLDYPFPENIVVRIPNDNIKLSSYKILGVTNGLGLFFPISKYLVRDNNLILDMKTFGRENFLDLYLIDDTGKGILFNIVSNNPLSFREPNINNQLPNNQNMNQNRPMNNQFPNNQNMNQNQPINNQFPNNQNMNQNQPMNNQFPNNQNMNQNQPINNQFPNNQNMNQNRPINNQFPNNQNMNQNQPMNNQFPNNQNMNQNQPMNNQFPNNQNMNQNQPMNNQFPNNQNMNQNQPMNNQFPNNQNMNQIIKPNGLLMAEEGKQKVIYPHPKMLRFYLKENFELKKEALEKFTNYKELLINVNQIPKINRRNLLELPNDSNSAKSYVMIDDKGEIIDFVPEKDLKKGSDTIIN
ncbi:MAG: hypothetical protein U0457_21470 [Candidatus Sericytochromatia bacterium]